MARRRSHLGHGLLGAGLVALGLSQPGELSAQSQAAPTREEIQRRNIESRLRSPANPVAVAGEFERAPCPLANERFADLTFEFRAAEFSGLQGIDPTLLAPSYSQLVGREIPVSAICEIRDRAATILRAQGYLAAIQVPVQTIGEGTVRFDVLLARLRQTVVRGDPGNSGSALRRYLERLEAQDIFNANEAERYLLLARDIPGLDVRLTLQPLPPEQGGTPGDIVGVFDVIHVPVVLDVNIQNLGSRELGRFGGLARVRFNGLTGLADETMLSAYASQDFDEQLILSGFHEMRLGSEGLALGLSGTVAWSQPGLEGPDLFTTRTTVASAYARYPLVRSQASNLTLSGGGDLINQEVEFSDLDFTEDKLRVAFLRADYWGSDEASINGRGGYSVLEPRISYFASIEVRQGLAGLGASSACAADFSDCLAPGFVPPSRLDADPSGFLVRGETSATWRPTPLFGLSARTRFQYSPDALLGYEQFSGGNFTVGRGYDPGAIIGDKGIGVQFELFQGSLIPETPNALAIQPFAFLDLATVSLNNPSDDSDRLTSTGGGIRMAIGRQALLDLLVAVPLERTALATSRGDARVLFSLTTQIEPWFD